MSAQAILDLYRQDGADTEAEAVKRASVMCARNLSSLDDLTPMEADALTRMLLASIARRS